VTEEISRIAGAEGIPCNGKQIMTTSTDMAVHFEKVSFSYGKLEVISELTTSIPTGEICGVLGANGAGKTTVMRILMGLLKPVKGSVIVLGDQFHRNNLGRIGYMPQFSALYQELSVEENLHFLGECMAFPTSRIEPLRLIRPHLS
jgi:ABC-2 type transport system ATP-binding protein